MGVRLENRGLDTILVALGERDEHRIDAFAKAVIDVAAPAGATVVIAHVLTEETYRAALEEVGEDTRSLLETRFKEGVPAHPTRRREVVPRCPNVKKATEASI